MALADPQTLTINAVAHNLAFAPGAAVQNGRQYRKDTGSHIFTVQTAFGAKRNRFTARLNHNKVVTDPLVVANNIEVSASVYLVMDMPVTGYTTVEIKDLMLGVTGWASSATLLRVLGGES